MEISNTFSARSVWMSVSCGVCKRRNQKVVEMWRAGVTTGSGMVREREPEHGPAAILNTGEPT